MFFFFWDSGPTHLSPSSARRPLIPKSAYYFGPPPADSAYGTPPIGQIGLHHPREILRIERDYTGGELIQFAPIYPLELAGRVRLGGARFLFFRAERELIYTDNTDSVSRVDKRHQRATHFCT